MIGDPVAHSLSPAIHNAAFAAAGLDWVFVGLRVPAGSTGDAVRAVATLGLGGMSVTMPHKEAAAAAVDRLESAAAALGAVNCVVNGADGLVGANTDGEGFLDGLRTDLGVDADGLDCVVVGAGGAGRAVAAALGGAGARRVGVYARRAEQAHAATHLAGPAGVSLSAEELTAALRSADLVVNATPVGMGDDRGMPVDAEEIRPGCRVVDLVYHPRATPLLRAAAERGCPTANGVGMLVGQAAAAFERWTGRPAPRDAMRAAVAHER